MPKELMSDLGWETGDRVYLLVWNQRILIVRDEEVSHSFERLYRELALPE